MRETLFSLQAAPSLSTQSRPLRADELLPERALLGDEVAREELYRNVYLVLHGDNEDDPRTSPSPRSCGTVARLRPPRRNSTCTRTPCATV